jgi:GT2 family glycosyltransferase/glycosyltransferase involved in cell wall biosynthesis
MSQKLKVGNFSYGGHAWQADMLRDTIEDLGMKLYTSHEYPNADVPYNKDTICQFIDTMDIIILPSRRAKTSAKSVNRLAQVWSRGKPCIVSPLPAYLEYATDEEDVLVAWSELDWPKHLVTLRDNPEKRISLGKRGLEKARKHFNPWDLSKHFFEAVEKADKVESAEKSFIQIIIPHYLNRTDYLKLAVGSALRAEGPNREVLVVSSAAQNYENELSEFKRDSRFRFIHSAQRLNFSQANNLGLSNLKPEATHILLLNDDTIMSRQFLKRALETMGTHEDLILNPYSNCDKGWLHNDYLTVEHNGVLKELVPAQSIEEMEIFLEALEHKEVPENKGFSGAAFCAMYGTFMHRKVFEKVGYLNTTFQSGGEDLDYSRRAQRFGITTAWTRNSFLYHFGGRSRKFSEETNFEKHHEEDRFNNTLVHKMWGRDGKKKSVCIWSGAAFEQWDLLSYKRPLKPGVSAGIGGSETCAARLAMEFAKDGHYVLMAGDHPKCEQEGVDLIPWNTFRPDECFFDLFVASRNLNCIDERLRAKTVVVWVHDIFILSHREPHNTISDFHLKRVDYYLALSPWHKQFLLQYHKNIPEEKILIVPNGVNTELFN